MTIQQIKYVLAVAKYAHFETAADSCFVTQSTLSTMINKLEDELGIYIFNRKTKPVSITKEGEVLIDRMRILFHEFESLENSVQEMKGELVGELRIGIIPTISPYLLPLFLTTFAARYPKVKMIVTETTTENIQRELKARNLDVGILAISIDDKELEEKALYEEPFFVFDCKSSRPPSQFSIEELDYSDLWFLEEGHCLRTQVRKICDSSNKESEKSINIEFKAGSIDSLMRFTKANKGVTILPYLSGLEISEEQREHIVPFCSPVPVRTVGLAVHKHFVRKKLLAEMETIIKKVVLPYLPKVGEVEALTPI